MLSLGLNFSVSSSSKDQNKSSIRRCFLPSLPEVYLWVHPSRRLPSHSACSRCTAKPKAVPLPPFPQMVVTPCYLFSSQVVLFWCELLCVQYFDYCGVNFPVQCEISKPELFCIRKFHHAHPLICSAWARSEKKMICQPVCYCVIVGTLVVIRPPSVVTSLIYNFPYSSFQASHKHPYPTDIVVLPFLDLPDCYDCTLGALSPTPPSPKKYTMYIL